MHSRLFTCSLVIALASGCDRAALEPPPAPPRSVAAPDQLSLPPTTHPELALRNLELQLRNYQRMSEMRTLLLEQYAAYVGALSLRARFLGRLSDHDTLIAVAERVVAAYPNEAEAYLLRAQVRSGLHLFVEARMDLDKAIALGLHPPKVDKLRAALLASTGKLDEALVIRERLAKAAPSIYSLGDLATLHAELGNEARAEQLFRRALAGYRDRSPFAVVWLLFQRGLMHERAGQIGRARDSYHLAYQRLPAAPIMGHLAGAEAATGNELQAIALLRQLVDSTNDPEYAGQLGELLSRRSAAGAQQWIVRARRGYEVLVAKHPLAFADHAARFWLGAGNDARRAVTLARRNLDNRQTDEAYQLLLDAHHAAASDAQEQCRVAEQAGHRQHASAYLLFAVSRAYRKCGRGSEADRVLTLASAAPRKQ